MSRVIRVFMMSRRQGVLLGVMCLALMTLFVGDKMMHPLLWISNQILPGGLMVTYYAGDNFDKAIEERRERRVVIDYGLARPAWRLPNGPFSARWEGYLTAPEDALYSFYLQSQDGSRLWIDDELVIDHWNSDSWVPGRNGVAKLSRGRHRIRIEHCRREGKAAIRIRWSGGGIPDNTVLGVPYLNKR